jgi:hypothetical protein
MLSVAMPDVIMLSVAMPNAITLSVVAPFLSLFMFSSKSQSSWGSKSTLHTVIIFNGFDKLERLSLIKITQLFRLDIQDLFQHKALTIAPLVGPGLNANIRLVWKCPSERNALAYFNTLYVYKGFIT